MYPGFPKERRKHRRYILRGKVSFRVDAFEHSAELVNFGFGGMLIRSNFGIPQGCKVLFRVLAFCYPNSFEVAAEVVGGTSALMALKFLEKPAPAHELSRWLEAEHFPWSGTFSPEEIQLVEPSQPYSRKLPQSLTEAELEDFLDAIFRSG